VAPRRLAALALTAVLAWLQPPARRRARSTRRRPIHAPPCARPNISRRPSRHGVDVATTRWPAARLPGPSAAVAAPLFLEAGNAYEKAAVFSARLAQNVGASRDSQRRDATVYWACLAHYSLAAQLNVTAPAALAEKALTHIPEPNPTSSRLESAASGGAALPPGRASVVFERKPGIGDHLQHRTHVDEVRRCGEIGGRRARNPLHALHAA